MTGMTVLVGIHPPIARDLSLVSYQCYQNALQGRSAISLTNTTIQKYENQQGDWINPAWSKLLGDHRSATLLKSLPKKAPVWPCC